MTLGRDGWHQSHLRQSWANMGHGICGAAAQRFKLESKNPRPPNSCASSLTSHYVPFSLLNTHPCCYAASLINALNLSVSPWKTLTVSVGASRFQPKSREKVHPPVRSSTHSCGVVVV